MSAVKFKNPNAPATAPQLELFNKILAERGYSTVEHFAEGTTIKQASEAIDNAKTLGKAQPAAKPSLLEMAAAIEGKANHCTECNDTGIWDWDDDGADPETGAPIMRPLYCKCPAGQAEKSPVQVACDTHNAQADHTITMAGKVVASAPITTTPPELNDADWKIIRGALSCYFAEADGDPESWDLAARVEGYLKAKGL
jgi:hypothetical protein